jgi:hypothetical protein
MYTKPSAGDMIDGVLSTLMRDVLPELTSQKAVVAVVMAQALLENVKQRIPVEQQIMAAEHNQMVELFGRMAATAGGGDSPEAARIRDRGATLGQRQPVAAIPAYAELQDSYRELSDGLVDTLRDLDVLITAGSAAAEAALQDMRAYLGPRTVADFTTYFVGAGMAGRG